jgi:hypothetical protein
VTLVSSPEEESLYSTDRSRDRQAAVKSAARRFVAMVQDLPADQLPLLLSVGLVIGVFPIAGCPTVFCLLAAAGLRLNLPALQVLNNVSSPLQLALLLPLARAGARICRASAPIAAPAAKSLAFAALHAITGWACICVPLGVLLYFALLFLLRSRFLLRPAFR